LPLTSGQFIKVTGSTSRKSVAKLPQKSMLRQFAKASEAEIWTCVRRRYLASFAGLHFDKEPGLTELDAAEGRRNKRLYLKGGNVMNTIMSCGAVSCFYAHVLRF